MTFPHEDIPALVNPFDGTRLLDGTVTTTSLPPHVCSVCGSEKELLRRRTSIGQGRQDPASFLLACWGGCCERAAHAAKDDIGRSWRASAPVQVKVDGQVLHVWPTTFDLFATWRPEERLLLAWRILSLEGTHETTWRGERHAMALYIVTSDAPAVATVFRSSGVRQGRWALEEHMHAQNIRFFWPDEKDRP